LLAVGKSLQCDLCDEVNSKPPMVCTHAPAQFDARLMTQSVAVRKKERKKNQRKRKRGKQQRRATEVNMRMRCQCQAGTTLLTSILVQISRDFMPETCRKQNAPRPAPTGAHLRCFRGPLRDALYHVIYHITKNDHCCLL